MLNRVSTCLACAAALLNAAIVGAQLPPGITVTAIQPNLNKTYPTLSELCLDAATQQSASVGLPLVIVVASPTELIEVQLTCGFREPGPSSKIVSSMEIQPVFIRLRDAAEYRTSFRSSRVALRIEAVGTVPVVTLLIAFDQADVIAARFALRLREDGQPAVAANDFSSLVPGTTRELKSGVYWRIVGREVAVRNAMLEVADPVFEGTLGGLDQVVRMNLGLALGWRQSAPPTNNDPEKRASRVDFAKALKELQALLQDENLAMSDADYRRLSAPAVKAIQAVE